MRMRLKNPLYDYRKKEGREGRERRKGEKERREGKEPRTGWMKGGREEGRKV